jgi:uncharacterized membrane protein
MSAVDVTTEIIIQASISEVAAFASNPGNAPRWYVNIKSVEPLPGNGTEKTSPHLQVGSRIAFKAKFLGRQLSYVYEIAEWIPGEKMTMRTADGPFPMETTYTWEKVTDSSTRMRLRNKGNPSGFSKLIAPFMSFMIRKANRKDLRHLKRILEYKKSD